MTELSLSIKNKVSSLKIKNANSRAKNFFNSSFLGVDLLLQL